MPRYGYYAAGTLQTLSFQPLERLLDQPRKRESRGKGRSAARGGARSRAGLSAARLSAIAGGLHDQKDRLAPLFHEVSETTLQLSVGGPTGPTVIPTETIVVEPRRATEIKWLQRKFGLEVVSDSPGGRVLLRSPEGGAKGVALAFDAAQECFKRGHALASHRNFLRIYRHIRRSAAGGQPLWNHRNDGSLGVPGADVAAEAAWTITRGKKQVRVAVLDEGVDTRHPALKSALVAENDFVDGHTHARPDGNDAHGTACAGIVLSRDGKIPGLAPETSLVAVRIAKGDGQGNWISLDSGIADAIDWAWDEARADVLSNSWGGGPPVDIITNAFERARTQGRGGKGCVIVVAAGNEDGPVSFPGTLPNVLTVGASNPWDERKSQSSKDNETWWGSNYGPALDLLAPGVRIATTDIRGARGYSSRIRRSPDTQREMGQARRLGSAEHVRRAAPRSTVSLAMSDYFYYANGQPVELVLADDVVAIDEGILAQMHVPAEVAAPIERGMQRLVRGLALIPAATLPPGLRSRLDKRGAVQPVFRAQGATLVPLPEVRVEESRPDKAQEVRAWLKKRQRTAAIVSQRPGRVVIRPVSGRGVDALQLAVALHDEVGPELAQPDFVRLVRRS